MIKIAAQLLGFAGSLSLLLFGMNMLSEGIQKGAGNSLQQLLKKITGNRFTALLCGMCVTAVIQSSGATTVMVVSFVNAEILTLSQAIGVIFGANIGTTITAWIVAFFGFSFSIASAALPIFAFGFFIKHLKKHPVHNFAECFMGFSLLFLGLGLLKESLSLSDTAADFLEKLSYMGIWGIVLGVLSGTLITALLHSSSAMTAIVLTMAANGAINFKLASAIILGSNIGSTVDALMSSFGASTNAKRTAFVHVGFNTAGTLIVLLFFTPFLNLIDYVVPGSPKENITMHIAMLHTFFNVLTTLIFIPFVNQINSLVCHIIKEKTDSKDEHYHFPAILPGRRINADLYAFQAQKEISVMAQKDMEMFDNLFILLENKILWTEDSESSDTPYARINFLENYIDEMNDEIINFLQECSRLPTANAAERKHFSHLIHITDCLEGLSDECWSISYTLGKYIKNADSEFYSQRKKELSEYMEYVRVFFEHVCSDLITSKSLAERKQSDILEQKIDEMKHKLRKTSRYRMEEGSNIKAELGYSDLVRKIEKAGDCIYSIVAG